jgi:hypothetical protein
MSGATLVSDLWTALNAFSGASLGASFYVLIKTQPYLSNRSYDPKFNAAYISRFMTGVIGGVILAIALGPLLTEKLQAVAGSTLTPGVLAIMGGFSAEAVESILQRLVEVLLAAVRGDGSGEVKAKVNAAAANKDSKVEKALDDAMDAGNSPTAAPGSVGNALKKVRDELRKPI